MAKYRFEQIAVNCTTKKIPTDEERLTYIGLEHLDPGRLIVDRWGSAVPIIGEKLIMHKGDVLLGKRNAYLRRAAIAPHDGVFSAHGMVLQPHEEVIDKDFFPLFIASDYFFDTAIKISVGSLSPTVNWKDLRITEFDLPNLETQRQLAEVLWSMVEAKEAYLKLLRQTDELVKAQFIEMFGDPKDNPRKWPVQPLKETCRILTGNTPSRKVAAYYGSYIEWIKSDNIVMDSIHPTQAVESLSESGAEVGRVVQPGTILMICIAGSLNTIGNIAIVNRAVAFNQQINALIPEKYEPLFLYHLLLLIRPQLHEITNNTLKCILNKGTLGAHHIIVPDRQLQIQFVAFAEQLNKSKYGLLQSIKLLESIYKQILLQNLG